MMTHRIGLRHRVAFTFMLFGGIISLAMGVILYGWTISMEERLIDETLSIELESFINRYTLYDKTTPPSSVHIHGYVITEKTRDTIPEELHDLSVGPHHLTLNDKGFYVIASEKNHTQFLVLYDDEQIRHREQQYLGFLLSGVLLMTLLSAALGFWLARKVIAPVSSLAKQVSDLGAEINQPLHTSDFANDEVGELANAVNRYRGLLSNFVERERSFTGDISHELRTPVAVIDGAKEVLLINRNLDQSQLKPLERIDRATNQMNRLISALLFLAREETDKGSSVKLCQVDEVLKQVVDEHRYLLDHKPVTFSLEIEQSLAISCDRVLLHVVLANLVRNAFSYTHQGNVVVRLQRDAVVIEDTGIGMGEDQLRQMFERHYSNHEKEGHGIGLSLVKRICQRYAWTIQVQSRKNRGTSVQLHFTEK